MHTRHAVAAISGLVLIAAPLAGCAHHDSTSLSPGSVPGVKGTTQNYSLADGTVMKLTIADIHTGRPCLFGQDPTRQTPTPAGYKLVQVIGTVDAVDTGTDEQEPTQLPTPHTEKADGTVEDIDTAAHCEDQGIINGVTYSGWPRELAQGHSANLYGHWAVPQDATTLVIDSLAYPLARQNPASEDA